MHRNWIVTKTNPDFLRYLSNKASISTMLAQVLVNRGFKDVPEIKDFLSPSLSNLHDPFLMPDMKGAVERLKSAVDRDEKVLVHGDYDADGVTATTLLVLALRQLGLKTFYHIPNRIAEGYGFSDKGIQKAEACGAGLIITVDCGISSAKEVRAASAKGMDVIVTDHHEPPEELPPAIAVIDPHRRDSLYPFKYLAGVGVAYKLIQALFHEFGIADRDERLKGMLDLVALGTIADSVPLIGENRVMVVHGLEGINGAGRTGIQALKEAAGVNKRSRAGSLSYSLIPRINAAGRLDDAAEVVELLLADDKAKARDIADRLEEQNKERQKIEADVLKAALDMINPDDPGKAIVLSSPDWHPGVIGIVASRLVDLFYRPAFLFAVEDSFAKGSARGIPPLHLYKAVSECSELMLGFGGHRQAAGLRIAAENLPAFKSKMNFIVSEKLSAEDLIPVLEIDAAVKFSDLSFNFVRELSILEPYGISNRQPVFGTRNTEIVNQKIVGNNHLKMRLKQERIKMDTIGFSMGKQGDEIGPASSLDIAFMPCINEWNGTKQLQLNLKAIRLCS